MSDDICPCCEAKQRAELVAREWERQSKQWEGACKLLRKKLDDADQQYISAVDHRATVIAGLRSELDTQDKALNAALISAHEIIAKLEATIVALERRLAEAQQGPAAAGG